MTDGACSGLAWGQEVTLSGSFLPLLPHYPKVGKMPFVS